MQRCPKCVDSQLQPVQPAAGLAARQCVDCHGLLLDLLSYRQWREQLAAPVDFANQHHLGEAGKEADDTTKALLCTKCARLMTKYRVSGNSDNRLDFCVHCSEVWLDDGELALLDTPHLDGDLGRIFTAPWQQAVVRSRSDRLAVANLAEHLGQDLDRVEVFATWLAGHPERPRILAYLRQQQPD